MKHKIRVLTLARDDLREAANYLSEFGELPPKRFRESFKTFTMQVLKMPFMFPVYIFNAEYRRAVILYDFLVFYKVDEQTAEISVYRVLHSSRNVESII